MATPSYATDLNDLYLDTDNFSTVGGGRVTASETDDYIQGNNCWSHDPFSSGIEGGIYDQGTAPTITADDAVYIWTKCDVAATLATHAAGGIQILIGDSSTKYDAFYVAGSDDYQYGGWKCYPVDPTLSPSTNVGGTPTVTDHFGVRWNVPATGASKGYPMKIDAIREGRQASVTAGDSGDPATWAKLATHDATGTRQWGICQPNDAGAEVQGIVNWGTGATACYFDDDSGQTIVLIDTEFTSTDFTKIIIDHASTVFNMDGLTIKALGTNNPGQFIFNNASTTAALDNNTFASIGITTLRAGVTATNSKWTLASTVTQNGATLDTCTFDKSSASTALVSDDIEIVTDCTFNSDGTGHAVDLGTIAATDSIDWDNYASAYVAGSTGSPVTTGTSGNETILCNVASGQTLTINVGTGYTTPSVKNDGTGTVNVVAGQVTTKVTVQDITTDVVLEDANVLVWVTNNDNYFYQATPTSITGSGTTATVTQIAHGLKTGDHVIIEGVTNLDTYNGAYQVTVSTVDVYTYTASATLSTSPAVATQVSTYHFDGSDAGATDPNAVWTDETNSDDGSTSTYASTTTQGSSSSNFILIEGTNAPATGGSITQVRARIYGYADGSIGPRAQAMIYTNGLAESLNATNTTYLQGTSTGWGSYYTLSTPTGGWDWSKLQSLEVKTYGDDPVSFTEARVYKIELEVTSTPDIYTTFAVINEVTGATGIVTDTRTWSSAQAITGRVRKGTYDPSPPTDTVSYYIQGKVGGTISTTAGFTTTVALVRDE